MLWSRELDKEQLTVIKVGARGDMILRSFLSPSLPPSFLHCSDFVALVFTRSGSLKTHPMLKRAADLPFYGECDGRRRQDKGGTIRKFWKKGKK